MPDPVPPAIECVSTNPWERRVWGRCVCGCRVWDTQKGSSCSTSKLSLPSASLLIISMMSSRSDSACRKPVSNKKFSWNHDHFGSFSAELQQWKEKKKKKEKKEHHQQQQQITTGPVVSCSATLAIDVDIFRIKEISIRRLLYRVNNLNLNDGNGWVGVLSSDRKTGLFKPVVPNPSA